MIIYHLLFQFDKQLILSPRSLYFNIFKEQSYIWGEIDGWIFRKSGRKGKFLWTIWRIPSLLQVNVDHCRNINLCVPKYLPLNATGHSLANCYLKVVYYLIFQFITSNLLLFFQIVNYYFVAVTLISYAVKRVDYTLSLLWYFLYSQNHFLYVLIT